MSQSRLNSQPLYLQLRDVLAERVAKNLWGKNEPLPSESHLADEFGVSIGTVRKAVDELVAKGLLERRQGRGTFCIDRRTPAFQGVFDRLRNADGSPIAWSVPKVSFEIGPATEAECKVLALNANENVIRFERTRSTRGRPVLFETSCVPESLFGADHDALRTSSGITSLANTNGIILGQADVKLTIGYPTLEAAAALQIGATDVIQIFRRVTHAFDARPLESCQAWFHLLDEFYSCVHHPTDQIFD